MTPINFTRWFVAPINGDSGTAFLVCASDKLEALASFIRVREDQLDHVLPIQTFAEWHKGSGVPADAELRYQVGMRDPNSIVLGTVILIS